MRFQSERPMTSIEKVQEVGDWLAAQPTDGEMGTYLQLFAMAAPFVADSLPQDPCELDAQLEALGEFIDSLRSDPESETPCNEAAAAAHLERLSGGASS